jgi:hypothetical protein
MKVTSNNKQAVNAPISAAMEAFSYASEKVPGTGEVARFPAETLGTHKDLVMPVCNPFLIDGNLPDVWALAGSDHEQ